MAMAMAKRRKWAVEACTNSPMGSLDDGCLMHIFSFLPPIPDRYNTALVSKRWRILACHPRLWLRVERPLKNSCLPGVFPTLEAAVSAARPGDTILIAAGETHIACNVQIKKPLCFMGGGKHPDETLLTCYRGFDSALEFESNCKISNLTIRTELGCCLHHRSGKLTIEGCILQCEENPLDYLSFPIMSTAPKSSPSQVKEKEKEKLNGHGPHGVSVMRTRLEGGAKAVCVNGELVLNHVRAIYSRASILFWFEVAEK